MKEMVYLDTSFLHSFIAQIFDGLPQNITKETGESRTTTNTEEQKKDKDLELQAGVKALLTANSKRTTRVTGSTGFSLAQLEVGKEIISKQIHDNSLNDLLTHLKENDMLADSKDISYQKFIVSRSTFSIIEIEKMRMFLKKEFSGLLGIPLNPQKGHSGPSLKDMTTIFDFIETLLPKGLYFRQDGVLALLKQEYLRESPESLYLKYGDETEVTLLGKITRRHRAEHGVNDQNAEGFGDLSKAVNLTAAKLLEDFIGLNEGDYIVSPIAIYFELI